MKKKKNLPALRWVGKRLMPQIVWIILLVLVYCVLAACGVYTALVAKNAVDSAVNGNKNEIMLYGSVLAGIIVLQVVLRVVNSRLTFRVGAKLENSMSEDLFARIIGKEYAEISKYHTGELMNRINGDVSVISTAVTSILPHLAYVIVKLAGIFIVLCSVDPWFAAVFAAGGLIIWVASSVFKGKMKEMHKEVQSSNGRIRSFLQEALGSTLVIKAFSAENKVRNNAHRLMEDNYKIKKKRIKIVSLSSGSVSFAFSAGYLYGIIWGAVHIADKAISYGTFTAVLSLISQVQTPVSELSSLLPQYYSAIASAERIIQLEQLKDEQTADSNFNASEIYKDLECISFENVSFAYSSGEVFENASLSLRKGEFAVISGISGIGKSTLLKLLMGVFPPGGGKILLRLKSGENLVSDSGARRMFAYVPQGNFLLSGTIRENLCFANENAGEEEIERALKIACCDFVKDLPDALETKIGENGQGLSEGQVQRLAIARALLGGAPILLFDEATSALDEATELALLKNLRALSEHTCVLITHKAAALSVCDKKIEIVGRKIFSYDANVNT